MLILVNVFAIVSAILLYTKKIRPEPFLLGSLVWLLMMSSVWYILPYTIYKRAATFKDHFTIEIDENEIALENAKGYSLLKWTEFNKYFESPHFFHLYFNERSFFLIPKDDIDNASVIKLRNILSHKIENSK